MHRVTTRRTGRLIVIAGATLAMLAAVAAPAAAAKPTDEAKAKAEHERVVRYWTAERIAGAKPRDITRSADGALEYASARPERGKPPGGGGGGTGDVVGASWPNSGPVVAKTGKVLFTMGGGNWVCSATVIAEPGNLAGYSLVLSAAHCIYDEADDVWATNWIFVPSFDTAPTFTCAQATIGCWTATGLAVHRGWANEEELSTEATKHDFGVAVVAGGGKSGNSTQLDAAVGGGYTVSTSAITVGTRVHAFGYPAGKPYKGNDLIYCNGPVFQDSLNLNATWGVGCNMTGGSSGGPWFKDFTGNGAGGTVTSLNSYGYGKQPNMYGPKFNSATQAVINAAAANPTSTTITP